MPTVPEDYSGKTVKQAKTSAGDAGLKIVIVPNKAAKDGRDAETADDDRVIETNADGSELGTVMEVGGTVGVVLRTV